MPNNKVTVIRNINTKKSIPEDKQPVIAILDSRSLHSYILKKVAKELQYLVEDCYYPRISDIYKELLHTTKANEKSLKQYAKEKYKNPNWKLLHDPQTILLVLITQDFTRRKDYAAALATFNLLSLRYYTNVMYKFIQYCNPEYFRAALDNISHNHLFNVKRTISDAILYLSSQVYKRYKNDLENDNSENIVAMIYSLRTRINQSARSFAKQYYRISETGGSVKNTNEDLPEQESVDKKLKQISSEISREITVYGKKDNDALNVSKNLSKFNRKLSDLYVNSLNNPKHTDNLEVLILLLLRQVKNLKSSKNEYLNVTRKLMSVKISKKPIYFKKILTSIHDQIIEDLNLTDRFNNLSVQSKHISRSFLAYYISTLIYNYFN